MRELKTARPSIRSSNIKNRSGVSCREAPSFLFGDFDKDGLNDLAVTNGMDDTVSILLGMGDGTFESQQTASAGSNPMAIACRR